MDILTNPFFSNPTHQKLPVVYGMNIEVPINRNEVKLPVVICLEGEYTFSTDFV